MLLFWFLFFCSLFALFGVWLFARLFLIGKNMRRYDSPRVDIPANRRKASSENAKVLSLIKDLRQSLEKTPMSSRVKSSRALLDKGIGGAPVTADSLQVERLPVDANGVPAEWIRASGSNPQQRLLYIHGGAFTSGSPSSHRYITAQLARLASISVLAIDYRLMPEHTRSAGIADCKTAYQWMLENGPDGTSRAANAYVAGDSAGGNLTLMLIAWLRDAGLRQVDAAVALSPLTDATLSSPTMRTNIETDPFLGPSMGKIMRIPRTLLAFITLMTNRIRPKNPRISPLRGNLENLPPTLLHASAAEMVFDDSQRYANKTHRAGSPIEFQAWGEMVHVWHLFSAVLPEARDALQQIAAFIQRHPGNATNSRSKLTAHVE